MWGPSTWIMFHTFAEKIRDDIYLLHKEECYKFILEICKNLLCSICVSHSINYLNNIKSPLNTKHSFKIFLFDFHNHINKSLGKKIYDINRLKMYENANYESVFNYYIENVRLNNETEIKSFLKKHNDWFK